VRPPAHVLEAFGAGDLPRDDDDDCFLMPVELAARWPSRVGRVEQRVSLITLGVRDLARARAFYEALGWTTGAAPADDVVFFQAGGIVVALWSRDELAEDSGVEDSGGWGGVTLAYNVRSPAEVDAVIAEAEAAGATIPRHGAATFWGGYSGVFVDPAGHPWEVAHNPRWTITEDGATLLS
jgi:predicted lactoylglutathione lyase